MRRSTGEGRAAALAAALAPYAWRDLTDRMLARCAVGAADRHSVVLFLSSVPGADVDAGAPLVQPAAAEDERVEALVAALDGQQWREWSLGRLAAQLLSWLDSWHAERDAVDAHLRRLLDEL